MLQPIEQELARKVLKDGQEVYNLLSPFKTPKGDNYLSSLMIFNYKFYLLTIADMGNNVGLAKGANFEMTLDEAKELFGEYVNFIDFEISVN